MKDCTVYIIPSMQPNSYAVPFRTYNFFILDSMWHRHKNHTYPKIACTQIVREIVREIAR